MHISQFSLCAEEDSSQQLFHFPPLCYPETAKSHLNPLRLGNKVCTPLKAALRNSNSDSDDYFSFPTTTSQCPSSCLDSPQICSSPPSQPELGP